MTLTLIGYWRSDEEPHWPDPKDWIDDSWDEYDRFDVADYLQRGFMTRAFAGYSHCRICGIENGDLELTDGTYVWPSGLTHYVLEHSVRLPEKFINHIDKKADEVESMSYDTSWWESVKAPASQLFVMQ